MSLTSSSTDAQVRAAYDDNADYDIEGSVVKAKLFIQACRILLGRIQRSVRHSDAQVDEEYQKISDQLKMAMNWWTANDTAATPAVQQASVRHFDFRNVRS